uniref:Uncharacterized protein n=1 Tax=Tanacetum cinerariifolium TaxID=118510 RepID=A0A6L2JLG8_TANCI|nr:hypothetical protein [Tanacetum cinerariifolium]
MADMTVPTGQAPTIAPPVRTNDQIMPRIRWVQTGYLKFSAKGTKREVFGMPIPGSLITANILQYLIHLSMCKDIPTKMIKMFLLDENLRQHNPDNREVLHPGQILFKIWSVTSFGTVISFTYAFSASPSDKKLESHDTLEERNDLPQPG